MTTAGPQRVAQEPPPTAKPATGPGAAVGAPPGFLTEDRQRDDEQPAAQVPSVEPFGGDVSGKAPAPVVNLLGPIQISPCIEAVTSKKVLELASFLASHRDRPYSADELCTVLWLPESDRGGLKTVRNYVSRLRRSIGAEYFPQGGDGGYALSPEVRTDIGLFNGLVEAARSSSPDEARELLRRALELVRGEPFGKIGESWVSDERLVEPIELAILRAARQLVRISLETGDIETAFFAADRGLLVSNDYGLCEDLLRVAAATSDGRTLDRAWARVCRLIGEEPHLMALAAELRGALRQAPARTRIGQTTDEQARLQ